MSQLIELFPTNLNPKIIRQIADKIENGAIIIYPTDTVYAIGCLSTHKKAIDKLAKLKNINIEKAPLSFLFPNISATKNYVNLFDSATYKLLNKCFPGPYAFIMPAVKNLPKPFQKRKSIGVRISNHPFLLKLLDLLPAPLITSSLHDKDKIIDYTTDPNIIFEEWYEQIDLMVSTGVCGNIPSTIIDLTQNEVEVLREGKGDTSFI